MCMHVRNNSKTTRAKEKVRRRGKEEKEEREREETKIEGTQHHRHAHPASHRLRPYATIATDLRVWGLQHGEVYPLRPNAWSQAAQLRTHARSKATG